MQEKLIVNLSQEEEIRATVPDINYIPAYKVAEEQRRANELERIEYYGDIQEKVENGEFDGKNTVYVGTEEPTDDFYNVWIDPNGTPLVEAENIVMEDGETLEEKFNNLKIANVLYHNIKSDGVTDNTTAIQDLINQSKKNKKTIYFPAGNYVISNTLKTYENINIELDENAYILINADVDGIYLDGNSSIKGGTILVNVENYSHKAITLLPASIIQNDKKIGGIYDLAVKNKTWYSTGSVGIGVGFSDDDNVYYEGICCQSILNCEILGFEYATKFTSDVSTEWVTSLSVDNLKMSYCKNFIYANMGREFTGNKFTNIHIQPDKNNLSYVIYLGGKCEDNYFNVIDWDLDTSLNQGCIYLSEKTLNNKLEMSRLFNYGTLKLISDNGVSNQITSPFIYNKYKERTDVKVIDLTSLDKTKCYPVLFENMCNIKLWKKAESGEPYSYISVDIDAVSQCAGMFIANYFVKISTPASQKLIPKIIGNNANRYIAVYLKGGFKYEFLDYNFGHQEKNSIDYYYTEDYKNPYKIVINSFTSGGITYTPEELTNSIPNGMYYNPNGIVNLTNESTPLTLN